MMCILGSGNAQGMFWEFPHSLSISNTNVLFSWNKFELSVHLENEEAAAANDLSVKLWKCRKAWAHDKRSIKKCLPRDAQTRSGGWRRTRASAAVLQVLREVVCHLQQKHDFEEVLRWIKVLNWDDHILYSGQWWNDSILNAKKSSRDYKSLTRSLQMAYSRTMKPKRCTQILLPIPESKTLIQLCLTKRTTPKVSRKWHTDAQVLFRYWAPVSHMWCFTTVDSCLSVRASNAAKHYRPFRYFFVHQSII